MAEFGVTALQKGRLARVIEGAYRQDAILDGPRLAVLFLETNRSLRRSLKEFWEQGAFLPVSGMRKENRCLMRAPRAVLALERYLQGGDLTEVRRSLAVSTSCWQRWWREFKAVLRGEEVNQPPEVVKAWSELGGRCPELASRLAPEEETAREGVTTSKAFYELLRKRHGYSPATSRGLSGRAL